MIVSKNNASNLRMALLQLGARREKKRTDRRSLLCVLLFFSRLAPGYNCTINNGSLEVLIIVEMCFVNIYY